VVPSERVLFVELKRWKNQESLGRLLGGFKKKTGAKEGQVLRGLVNLGVDWGGEELGDVLQEFFSVHTRTLGKRVSSGTRSKSCLGEQKWEKEGSGLVNGATHREVEIPAYKPTRTQKPTTRCAKNELLGGHSFQKAGRYPMGACTPEDVGGTFGTILCQSEFLRCTGRSQGLHKQGGAPTWGHLY